MPISQTMRDEDIDFEHPKKNHTSNGPVVFGVHIGRKTIWERDISFCSADTQTFAPFEEFWEIESRKPRASQRQIAQPSFQLAQKKTP